MWLKAEIECRGKCSLAQTILFQTFHTFSPLHIIYIALGLLLLISVLLSSVTKLCPTLYDPMVSFTPDFPVYHQLLELAQTHVHRASDTIQPSHPLSSPSPPAFNLSQHQGLFQSVGSSHQVARVLAFQLQHQSFQ